jgi:hypothetical protein
MPRVTPKVRNILLLTFQIEEIEHDPARLAGHYIGGAMEYAFRPSKLGPGGLFELSLQREKRVPLRYLIMLSVGALVPSAGDLSTSDHGNEGKKVVMPKLAKIAVRDTVDIISVLVEAVAWAYDAL